MKQLLQHLGTGETILEDVPVPKCYTGSLLIQTSHSLVSVGTERMLVGFGKSNLVSKARQQPERVKQVLEKAKTDGVMQTLETVRNKLDTPLALGYCNVGVVAESGAEGFEVGDRVVSNGKHAEFVSVPKNLCAAIPSEVDDESAAFTVVASIGLQGIRLLKPTLGEAVVVTGLGLIGLIAVQLLRAHGCRVLGIDLDAEKCALAREFGAETVDIGSGQDPLSVAEKFSRGRGVDAVLITASSKSDEPIHQAATMCRKRGRIVLVGDVGMHMSRADFYEKELSFQVSCSYGPGRYDERYEERGEDYPLAYVRWTEQRNFEAVLDMMASGQLDMKPLITHRFAFTEAIEAYDLICSGNPLGVLLNYAGSNAVVQRQVSLANSTIKPAARACLGFIGAGGYASSALVPAFAATEARLKSIASATGVSSVHVGKKFAVEEATTDARALLQDEEINALVISTRHNSHAQWVLDCIEHDKHIFVEKPLAMDESELVQIQQSLDKADRALALMVGFNRRYSPLISPLKKALVARNQPVSMIYTVNAGAIPGDHWVQDPEVGGGRLIGEVCHFIDLARFLAGSPILSTTAVGMDSRCNDTLTLQIAFENGSIAAIHYFANGHKSFPKERLEVFCAGSIAVIDNFRMLRVSGWPGLTAKRLLKQDKGQRACASAFVSAISKGDTAALIPFAELSEVSMASFEAANQISGKA